MDFSLPPLQPEQKKSWHPALGLSMMGLFNIFDKMAYYGMRSLLFVYMADILMFDNNLAVSYYGKFSIAIAAVAIIGGVLGDLAIPPVICLIIGTSLQSLACFVLAIPAGEISLLAGLALTVLGTAFTKANTYRLTADLYTGREAYTTAGFSVQYFTISLGAAISGFMAQYLRHNIHFAFICAGILSLFALVPLIIGFRTFMQHAKEAAAYKKTNSVTEIIALVLVLLSFPFFWTGFELLQDQFLHLEKGNEISQMLNTGITLVLSGFVFPLLFSFVKINPLFKISSGFFVMILALLCALSLRQLFLGSVILSAFSETLISIPSYAAIALYAPQQVRGVFFSLIPILSYLSTKMARFVQEYTDERENHSASFIVMLVFFLLSSAFMVMAILQHIKTKKNKLIPQNSLY